MTTAVLEAIIAAPRDMPARAWVFPALAPPAPAGPVVPDPAGWLKAVAAKLEANIGLPLTIEPGPASALDLAGFVRDDGVRLMIGLPRTLAAAIVNHRCGGAFDAGSVALDSPSVDRVHRELAALACRAWPGHGEWSACAAEAPLAGAVLAIGGRSFPVGFTLTVPAPAPAGMVPEVQADWTRDLRAAVAAMTYDLRVVLHEAGISLAAAVRLRAGDVIPIDTASAVVLRVGDHALARGTVMPDPHGGHVITIVGGPSRGLCPAPTEDLP